MDTSFEQFVYPQLQEEYSIVESFIVGAFLLPSAEAIVH